MLLLQNKDSKSFNPMHLFVREIQVREAYGLGLEICPWIVELGHCRCSTQNNNNNTMELRWQRCLHYSCTRNALVVVSAGDSNVCVPQIFDSTLSDTDRRKTCLPRLCAFKVSTCGVSTQTVSRCSSSSFTLDKNLESWIFTILQMN